MARQAAVRTCQLVDARVQPPSLVAVSLIRDFAFERLADVERVWTPARQRLATAMEDAGDELESGHWDWRNKVWSEEGSEHRLIAVTSDENVEGLMALIDRDRPATFSAGKPILYVDYLETAPWNLKCAVQRPRYIGVGTVLIGDAVQQSLERGLGGRVGLHALPQAERFYAERCRMKSHGRDESYYNLMYFESEEGVASQWLSEMGL